MAQLVIGTAGHIDHGKTALVEALTGTNTDRMEEEKLRGMTIDLGFAFLSNEITIIDVPGHERFIRNMVAGVSTIHLVLLVVAADDGIMPQTREHFNILKLLQIHRGVIAITKTDLAGDEEWLDLVEAEIEEMAAGSFLEGAPIIRTSVTSGRGIDELKTALQSSASDVIRAGDRGFFRHQIDRVFSKKGFGSVVTGTVISGAIRVGEEVEILPTGLRTKIRGMQTHSQEITEVATGDRAAMNLAGVDAARLWRGCEVATPGKLRAIHRFIAHINLLDDTRWQIKNRQRIHFHLGTSEVLAKIILLGDRRLSAGNRANVLIECEQPVVAATDDCFVIRSYSPMETIGGGRILDVDPPRRSRDYRSWGQQVAVDPSQRLADFVNRDCRQPKTVDQWARVWQTSRDSILKYIADSGLETSTSEIIFLPADRQRLLKDIVDFIKQYHQKNPYRNYASRDTVRTALKLAPHWFDDLIAELASEETIVSASGGLALSGHSVRMSVNDQKAADSLIQVLRDGDYTPPALNELPEMTGLNPSRVSELLHILREQSLVVEVQTGIWYHQPVIDQLIKELQQYFKTNESLKVGDFKELTGTTRKTAIPLLEYCDSREITFRVGDAREAGRRLNG